MQSPKWLAQIKQQLLCMKASTLEVLNLLKHDPAIWNKAQLGLVKTLVRPAEQNSLLPLFTKSRKKALFSILATVIKCKTHNQKFCCRQLEAVYLYLHSSIQKQHTILIFIVIYRLSCALYCSFYAGPSQNEKLAFFFFNNTNVFMFCSFLDWWWKCILKWNENFYVFLWEEWSESLL